MQYPKEIQQLVANFAPNGIENLSQEDKKDLAFRILQRREEALAKRNFWGKLWFVIKPILLDAFDKVLEGLITKPQTK